MKTILLAAILIVAGALGGCATTGSIQAEQIDAHPTLVLADSRANFLFAKARLRMIEGDLDESLILIRAAQQEDPTSAYLHTTEASILLKMNRQEEALRACNDALKLDAGNLQAHLLAGAILAGMKNDREAVEHYRSALAADPSREDTYLNLAICYVRLFEYELAVNALKDLVKVNPDSVMAYYYLGKTYDQMKLSREATEYYRKALAIRPDFEQALIDLGVTLEMQERYDEAITAYTDLLKLFPHNFGVIQHLIQLYIQENRLEDALELVKKISHSGGPAGIEMRRKAGLILLELERYKEAADEFAAILKEVPDNPQVTNQVRFYLAIAYEEQKEYDKALNEFGMIPVGAGNYYDALAHIAFIYKEKDQLDLGVALLRKEIEREPARVEPYLTLAGLFETIERYDEALKVLVAVQKTFASDPRIHFRLGVTYDKIGNREESIAHMKKVIELTPDDAQALNYIGYTYAEMGINLEEALKYLQKAISLRPNDGFILDSLGWVYYKLKRYDEAAGYLEQAMERVDDDATVIAHLADVYYAQREAKKALALYRKALQIDPERNDIAEKIRKIKAEIGDK